MIIGLSELIISFILFIAPVVIFTVCVIAYATHKTREAADKWERDQLIEEQRKQLELWQKWEQEQRNNNQRWEGWN